MGSGVSIQDSLADSLRHTLILDTTEGYVSSEEEVTLEPPPVVIPVRNVARVAEQTPTPVRNVARVAEQTPTPVRNVARVAEQTPTPVRNVAQVAEQTPTPPKGRVMAHISHFEKQVTVDEPVPPKRPSEGWKYLRAISENKRESQLESKLPVITERVVNKVAEDRGVNNVAEDRAPLENISRGVVSSLIKKSEERQHERNIFGKLRERSDWLR